ncbi:MAG: capsule assembly Wzi family protein [Chlorobiales bacterium]|nr:capsule assembly Wzi family protein [Chlorobiales bacterium]
MEKDILLKRLLRTSLFLSFLLLFVVAIMSPRVAFASGETFPAGHWAYDVIEQLVVRGHLKSLNDAARPFERVDVARALLESDKTEIKDRQTLWLFLKLEDELDTELGWLRDEVFPASAVKVAVRLEEAMNKTENTNYSPKFRGRGRLAFYFGEDFVIYNASVLQQKNFYDAITQTRTYGSSTGYTEQAFAAYHGKLLRVKIGRDYLDWGYGRNSLIVGKNAGSLDQIFLQLNTKPVRFTYFTAMLDPWNSTTNVLAPGTPSTSVSIYDKINRYFTAERLDLNLFDSNVRLGIWQGVVYGGKNQPIDFRFANPFLIYYGEEFNKSTEVNPLVGADLSVFPYEGLNVYASLVIDDWQMDNKSQQDLEPNEWGGIIGVRASNVLRGFDIYGTDAFIEFSKVTNRTYNQRTGFAYQKMLFGNNPIAHPLGTDFQSVEMGVSHWLYKELRLSASFKMIDKGEGNLQVWTEPWMDTTATGAYKYNLKDGYDESSPTGVVERTRALTIGAFYQPNSSINAELDFTTVWRRNVGHVAGVTDKEFQVFLRVMVELQPVFNLF